MSAYKVNNVLVGEGALCEAHRFEERLLTDRAKDSFP